VGVSALLRAGTASTAIGTDLLKRRLDVSGVHIGLITKRSVRSFDNIVRSRDRNRYVRSHAREQLGVRVVEADDRVVSDHVLNRGGVHTDFLHGTGKGLLRERVHSELNLLSGFDHAHIGLVGVRVHLHLGKVLRNGEERRSLQGRGNRLADVNAAGDDGAVDGRTDNAVVHVRLSNGYSGSLLLLLRLALNECGLRGVHQRDVGVVGGLGGIQLLLRHNTSLREADGAVIILLGLDRGGLRLGNVCPCGSYVGNGVRQVGLGLKQLSLENRGIDAGDDLPLLYLRVEVGIDLGNGAGGLRTDLNGGDGIDGAGRLNFIPQVALSDFGGGVLRGLRTGHDEGGQNRNSEYYAQQPDPTLR